MEIIPLKEKMKIYRELRQFSQQDLAEASGISISTIKKYEAGILNPKIDQIEKIADALNVSVYLFMDFNIETISDVFTLLYKMEEEIDMGYEIQKDEAGKPDYSTLRLKFANERLNRYLYDYMHAREMEIKTNNRPDLFATKEEYDEAVQKAFSHTMDIVLTRCLDDTLISKGAEYPGYSKRHVARLKELNEEMKTPEGAAKLATVWAFQPNSENREDYYLPPLSNSSETDDNTEE